MKAFLQQTGYMRHLTTALCCTVFLILCISYFLSRPSPSVATQASIMQNIDGTKKRVVPELPENEAYPQGSLRSKLFFDRLLVKKKQHRLYALHNGTVMRVYAIALGENNTGHRREWGDKRTPEGLYSIVHKDEDSPYYKALRLSFPNAADLLYMKEKKLERPAPVFIHGLPEDAAFLGTAHRISDWTNGSIALTNEEMDELFSKIKPGTPILIEP